MPHIKLINLLIRELHHCSLRGDFRVSRPAKIFQFDRFSLEINFKRARNCYYGIPRLGSNLQLKKKYTKGLKAPRNPAHNLPKRDLLVGIPI